MGAKIQIKNDSIKNFGGFYLFLDHFRKAGLDGIVDKTLGYRGVLAQYSYADIFSSLMAVYATGGTCVEDSARLSGDLSEKTQGYNFCSPDTILKMLGDFASEDTAVTSKDGKEYRFNINSRLNGMLLDGLIQCGQVNPQKKHIFDYDNQFIATEKKDARYSYKGAFGYFPGIAQVDGLPFYIEGRDGNANVKLRQADTLLRAFDLAREKGVRFDMARMDCGSYSEEIVKAVAGNCDRFYIRAMSCQTLRERIKAIPEGQWTEAVINKQHCSLASLPFTAFLEDRGYRLVAQRTLCEDGQTDVFDGQYVYRCILTNDHDGSEPEIVEFYNQRASTERCFDRMNNDFGWSHLPCSKMGHNTVFMILTAFMHNFFTHFLGIVARAAFGLSETSRVKRFVFSFVSVPFKWVTSGGRKILRLYTSNPAYLQLQV